METNGTNVRKLGKKPLILGPFDPNLGPPSLFVGLPPLCGRQCCKISLYEISKKTNDLNVYFFVCLFLFQKSGFASH